jgi:SOS-response transcriptional repressor LexA
MSQRNTPPNPESSCMLGPLEPNILGEDLSRRPFRYYRLRAQHKSVYTFVSMRSQPQPVIPMSYDADRMRNDERRKRLIRARQAAGFPSARAAAIAHNWPTSSYGAHENGNRPLNLESVIEYARVFGVEAAQIWGEPVPRLGPSSNYAVAPAWNLGEVVTNVGRATRQIKVVGRAAAGDGGCIVLAETVDLVSCPPQLTEVPDAYAVYVVGESMEPRYRAGEIVYVHPGRPCRRGDYVIVQVYGPIPDSIYGYIKEFVSFNDALILKQLNPPEELRFERSSVIAVHRIVMSGDG